MSGVYFVDNEMASSTTWTTLFPPVLTDGTLRSSTTRGLTGWTEAMTNKHPRALSCRPDYGVYYLLQHLFLGGGHTLSPDPCIDGLCGNFTAAYDRLIADTRKFDRAFYASLGQWYMAESGRATLASSTQAMFPRSQLSGLLTLLSGGSPIPKSRLLQLSRPSTFYTTFTAGCLLDTAGCGATLSGLCTGSTTESSGGSPMAVASLCDPAAIISDESYLFNMVVETAAFVVRYAAYDYPIGTFSTYIDSLGALGALPPGHVLGDGCLPSDLMSEWRESASSPDDGAAYTFGPLLASIVNFTDYRGRLPRSRLGDVAAGGGSATAGWPTMCSTCYYVGECVPVGGVCCTGTATSTSDPDCSLCTGTTDGTCTGYPISYRHSTESSTHDGYPPSTVTSCTTAIEYAKYLAGYGGTPAVCYGSFIQPIRSSFFVDTSRLPSFFTDVGPPSFLPTLTSWYSLPISMMFDVRESYLFGEPTYHAFDSATVRNAPDVFPFLADIDGAFPTLELTYERLSGDLTYAEVDNLMAGWDLNLTSTVCLRGGCYNALDTLSGELLNRRIDNTTLFTENGWFYSNGISLVGGLLRLYLGGSVNYRFYSDHLYGRASSDIDSTSTNADSTCTYATCQTLSNYTVTDTTACTSTAATTAGACCTDCGNCDLYMWTGSACWTCPSSAAISITSTSSTSLIGYGSGAYVATPTASTAGSCQSTCENRYPVQTELPPPFSTLYCSCWDYTGTTCRIHYNPAALLTASTGSSAGLAYGTVPLTSYVSGVAYSTSMGMTRGVPTIDSGSAYLGTSFDYLWTLGTTGPIPTSVTTPAATYVPIDLSTGLPVNRITNVFGLVGRLLNDPTSDDFEATVGGPVSTTSIAASLTTGDDVCSTSYCTACTLYKPDPSIFPSLWHHWCGLSMTRFFTDSESIIAGSSMSLDQSLSVLRTAVPLRLGYGTTPVSNREWYHSDPIAAPYIHAAPSLQFCWRSYIGAVGDPVHPGGLCVSTTGRCFWETTILTSGFRRTSSTSIGCGGIDQLSTIVTVADGTITWDTAAPANPAMTCSTDTVGSITRRVCEFDASASGHYPTMLVSASTYLVDPVPIPTAEPVAPPVSLFATLVAMCGCQTSASALPTTTITDVCLVDSECSMCGTTPTVPFYRCGTTLQPYGAGGDVEAKTRLCHGCPSTMIGQCGKLGGSSELSSCTSYDHSTGLCPTGYDFCAVLGLPSYTMKVPAVSALHGAPLTTTITELGFSATNMLYDNNDGTGGFVFDLPAGSGGYPVAGSMVAHSSIDLDRVNCVEVTEGLVLEQPRYLEPIPVSSPTDLELPPTGLTPTELDRWCGLAGAGDCSTTGADGLLTSRARLCVWNTSSSVCTLREITQADYEVYAPGKATFVGSHSVYYPTCHLWVPSISPASSCGDPRHFTGCVMTTTSETYSSHLSVSTSAFNNVPTSLYVPLVSTEYYVGRGGRDTILTTYTITALWFTYTGTSPTPTLPATTRIGYWNSSGLVTWYTPTPTERVLTHSTSNYYRLVLTTPLTTIGLAYLDTSNVLDDLSDLRGMLTGARMAPINIGASFMHIGFNKSATSTSSPIPETSLTSLLTTCVPLTMREELTVDTMNEMVSSSLVYRRKPIDCAMLASNAVTMGRPEIALLFQNGGICDDATSSQLAYLNNDPLNSVSTATNVRFFSGWYSLMSQTPTIINDGYIFFDTNAATTTTLLGFDLEAAATAAGNLLPGWTTGGIPSCGLTPSTSSCAVSIDRTSFVPCVNIDHTVWAQCQKPTMNGLYPRYAASDPTSDSGTFLYPIQLFKSGDPVGLGNRATDLLNEANSVWWNGAVWNQYMTMLHYCDFYFSTVEFPEGRPGYCDNDPLPLAERINFCKEFTPQYVFSGLVVTQLSLEDLCPWMSTTIENPMAYPYCLVFSDHPKFNSVQAFLSIRLPSGAEWNGKKFLYVPFKMAILSNILAVASVSNTLYSNHADASTYTRLTSANFRRFGPAGVLIYEKIAAITGSTADLDRLCDSANPITPSTIKLVYDIIMLSSSADSTYTFILLRGTPSLELASAVYTSSEVWSVFTETSTRIEYNDTTLTTAIPGVPAVIGTAATVTINEVTTCTRFQIDGASVVITGLTFDQSQCKLTEVVSQTPIIFSGAYAMDAQVYDITVIDSRAAVAVLGGNSIVYTFQPVISANGLTISDIRFTYPESSTINLFNRYIYLVSAKTLGVPIVSACTSTADTGWELLSNCVHRLVDSDLLGGDDCTATGGCLTPSSASCCSPLDAIVDDLECTSGYKCELIPAPNDQTLCNADACNCDSRSPCVALLDDLPVCAPTSTAQYRSSTSTTTTIPTYQDWQFYSNSVWYHPTTSYYSNYVGASVTNARGIGTSTRMMSISGPIVNSLTEASVIYREFSSTVDPSDPLGVVSVVPLDDTSVDGTTWQYVSSTQLVLVFDRLVDSPVFAGYSHTIGGMMTDLRSWCVGVDNTTSKLVVERCEWSSARWYIDPITTTVHLSGTPTMCITGTATITTLTMMPCRPCAVGSEAMVSPRAFDPEDVDKTSILNVTIDGSTITSVSSFDDSGESTTDVPTGNDVVLLIDSPTEIGILMNLSSGMCWTATPTGFEWYHTCLITTSSADPDAGLRGVFQSLTARGRGGPVHGITWDTPNCVCSGGCPVVVSITGTDGHGRGGVLSVTNDTTSTVLAPGFGYISSSEVIATPTGCTGRVITARVLIQPFGLDFDIETSGLELVNVTSFTSRYGNGHKYSTTATRATMSFVVYMYVLVMGFLVILAVMFHVVMIVYRSRLERRILSKLKQA